MRNIYYQRFLVVFIGLSIFTSCKTYFPPKVYNEVLNEVAYDVLIVPGFPFDSTKKNYLLKSRVLWAKHLFDQGICKNLIFTGGAVYSPFYESKIMALYAEELGIPCEHIFVENAAEHTTENLVFSYQLAKQNYFQKIGFATDVYQTTFIAAYLNRLGMQSIDLIPMRFSKIEAFSAVEMNEIDFNLAKKDNFESIRDSQTVSQRRKRSNGEMVKGL